MERIGIAFDGQPVLTDFSLRVESGEKVCLQGASGSGKSTLLKCLLGLTIPSAGQIRIHGQSLTPKSVWRLRQEMAWVPQHPDWDELTVRQALERPLAFRANQRCANRLNELPDWLARFNLAANLSSKRCDGLSGGEKQRVALIAALLLKRPVLLLDEITSALDETNREQIRDWLREAADITVLAVSHDTKAESWADRLVNVERTHA